MSQKTKSGLKIISLNRKGRFNYFFHEFFEAGIVLKGSEVKSLRNGKVSISDSYAFDDKGEIYLVNSHIPSYKESSYNDHNPLRNRKLLLNKKEISKILESTNQKGLTCILTSLYWKDNKIKCDIAIGKGKKTFDQREDVKQRDWNREKQRILKNSNR